MRVEAPRKWKDTNVSWEPVNSRVACSLARAVQYKCKLEQIRVHHGTRRRHRRLGFGVSPRQLVRPRETPAFRGFSYLRVGLPHLESSVGL